MCRKLFYLIAVVLLLGLAPLAQGDFVIGTRYLDGTAFEPDTDILRLDESLYLSIYVEEFAVHTGLSNYSWELICDHSLANITGGVLGSDAYDGYIYDHLSGRAGVFIYDLDPEYPAGLYADEFLYSPQSVGEVTVEFWGTRGNLDGYYYLIDSIVISQVPEPTMITLFALGSLLIHRRRICSK